MSPPNAPNPTINTITSDSLSTPNAPNPTINTITHLTHRELLCRRLGNTKRLIKHYRRMYWALVEELEIKHRQYVTETGLSPFEGESDVVVDNYTDICAFDACMSKPMPFTSFCFLHILSEPGQVLYKPCTFVISRSAAGPVTCQKPILRSTTPSYCTVHMQKAEMHLAMALKKAGLNISPMEKAGPNFHELVAKFVHQIQAKRRAVRGKECKTLVKKEEEEDAKESKTEVEKGDDIADE